MKMKNKSPREIERILRDEDEERENTEMKFESRENTETENTQDGETKHMARYYDTGLSCQR